LSSYREVYNYHCKVEKRYASRESLDAPKTCSIQALRVD
jgi:hypothetical protein